ncbi:uncharacterized protein LOC112046258 isoform X2 [Bicyclus anynana]|uniref:Uncharacterized protein LOC112046258 isoform X2 n=1 Tax=Bicyclus anynana TaxID=110368 RepID=A0ABM3LNE6_BICAN|nr:uncharacterized protein LOC112046258 isoform X2 [Bicyclus anynana]
MLNITVVFIVTYIAYSIAATTTTAKYDSAIKYPGPVHYAFDDRVHDSCRDLTYCTIKPDDYPDDKFNEMFKGYKSLPQPTLIEELKPDDNRQGHPDDEDDCYEPLYTVRPKRDDPWRTVIQAPEQDFVQRVRLETCSEPDSACFTNLALTSDYLTFCKQKVVTWEVLVAKGKNETEKIKAELPICCSCHYRPIDFARFGLPENNIKN